MARRAGAAPGGWKTLVRCAERLGLRSSAPQHGGVVRGASRSRSRMSLAARRPRRSQVRRGSSTSVESIHRWPELWRVARASRAHRGRARPALSPPATCTCGACRATMSVHHSHRWYDARVWSRVHRKSRAELPSVLDRRVTAGTRRPRALVCCNGVVRCRPASHRGVWRGSAERLGRPVGCLSHRTEWPSCPYDKVYLFSRRTRICEV